MPPYNIHGGYSGYSSPQTTAPGQGGGYQHTNQPKPPKPPAGQGGGGGYNNTQLIEELDQLLGSQETPGNLPGGMGTTPMTPQQIAQQAAETMTAQGQISGGIGGGVFTSTPVQYDQSFYTDEGWQEVLDHGWSSQLSGLGSNNILNDQGDPANVGGYSYDLPEGMLYSSNIPGGGYIYDDSVSGGGDGGGGGGGGYDGGGGGSGGGGGGGGGYNLSGSGLPQVYKRGSPHPGDLQERVNQAYLSGGRGFSRGGIVSLLRL
tara:strand:- start:245 stop:1027 length:783 start_codon:yes stop_codon:yes gene_type:complete